MREFEDLGATAEPSALLPMLLYGNANAKIRIAIELAFSQCMAEARAILRDAVEFVAHAHAMLRDPGLQLTWLGKHDGKPQSEAFKDVFERNKAKGLFKDLGELHRTWAALSETGPHANMTAMGDRVVQESSGGHIEFRLNFTGVTDPKLAVLGLFSMLLTCSTMEQTFFGDYRARLALDAGLVRMRADFDRFKEKLRESLVSRFDIRPPGGVFPPPKPSIFTP